MEEREKKRVPFHVQAEIRYDESVVQGEVENLSTRGMLVLTKNTIPTGTVGEVALLFAGATTELKLAMSGKVIRSDSRGTALQFVKIDLDAYIHLKNIVAYNSADPQALVREFEESRIDTSVHD